MVQAFICSKDKDRRHGPEAQGLIEILEKVGNNDYIVRTEDGVKCHAIWNPFAGWFADDVYAKEEK